MAENVELVDDGHYVLVKGRRWRATDPDLPDGAAVVLRRELMSARRAVGAALKATDQNAERAARARVQAAKVALGERGTPWWEQPGSDRRERWAGLVAELTILDLLSQRDEGKTICPSEVARAVGGETWRPLMEPVRQAARRLVEAGEVEITQHGEAVDLDDVKGPIRIRRVS